MTQSDDDGRSLSRRGFFESTALTSLASSTGARACPCRRHLQEGWLPRPGPQQLPESAVIVSKATAPERDAYSGFQDTDLREMLRRVGVSRAFVAGLATDYCVLSTVRDAIELGFQVVLLRDAVRAVDVDRGDGERAIAQMLALGAVEASLTEVVAPTA